MHTTSIKTEIKTAINTAMFDDTSQSEFSDDVSSLCSSN